VAIEKCCDAASESQMLLFSPALPAHAAGARALTKVWRIRQLAHG
jgi:hypothetical protein